jgi:hypothetical protein
MTAPSDKNFWQRISHVSITRIEVLLFLFLWLTYGVAINSDNLSKFNLQQIGVEAIVERHQFYLDGSKVPELQPLGDVFLFQGHKYAAKQPGQFIAGALVYWFLHLVGLRYQGNYLLTSALVTFLTTSLVLAASVVAVFRISRKLVARNRSLFWPLITAIGYGLGTTVFAYSGIAHHDALATGYLAIAFYLIFDLPGGGWSSRRAIVTSALAGFLLGLALTTSMLVFFMTLVCAGYFFWMRRWKLAPFFLVGFVAGLAPLLIYDASSFGNPFLLPNFVGAQVFSDTFFHFNARNFGEKLVWYSSMLAVYVPLFIVGVFGLSYYPRALKSKPAFAALIGLMLVLFAYILNIQTGGDCQFGPRYLMPGMPFACLGLTGFSYLSTSKERRLAGFVVILICLASIVINAIGAVQGAMCCPDGRNAFSNQTARLVHSDFNVFPLAGWLLVPLIIWAACLLLTLMRSNRIHLTRKT